MVDDSSAIIKNVKKYKSGGEVIIGVLVIIFITARIGHGGK